MKKLFLILAIFLLAQLAPAKSHAQQIDISKASVSEIKVMIYDQMVVMTTTQKNIQALEGELLKRSQEVKTPTEEVKEEVK